MVLHRFTKLLTQERVREVTILIQKSLIEKERQVLEADFQRQLQNIEDTIFFDSSAHVLRVTFTEDGETQNLRVLFLKWNSEFHVCEKHQMKTTKTRDDGEFESQHTPL